MKLNRTLFSMSFSSSVWAITFPRESVTRKSSFEILADFEKKLLDGKLTESEFNTYSAIFKEDFRRAEEVQWIKDVAEKDAELLLSYEVNDSLARHMRDLVIENELIAVINSPGVSSEVRKKITESLTEFAKNHPNDAISSTINDNINSTDGIVDVGIDKNILEAYRELTGTEVDLKMLEYSALMSSDARLPDIISLIRSGDMQVEDIPPIPFPNR